jgi:hypothetical protein
VPCDDPLTITHLAAQLPRLRSLDLRCCSEVGPQASTHDLLLTAATRLTGLRLHLSTAHPKFMQRLRMPPHLQVLPHGPWFVWTSAHTLRICERPGGYSVTASQHMYMMQAIDVSIVNDHIYEDAGNKVMSLINTLPLQVGLSAACCPWHCWTSRSIVHTIHCMCAVQCMGAGI